MFEGGGNYPAVAVALVALGSQSGTIDVVDVSANAVAASFSVHNNVIRGLRWLGNSKLVSFSYSQVHFFIIPVIQATYSAVYVCLSLNSKLGHTLKEFISVMYVCLHSVITCKYYFVDSGK